MAERHVWVSNLIHEVESEIRDRVIAGRVFKAILGNPSPTIAFLLIFYVG